MAQQFYSPLQLNSTLTVGVNDTGHDVKFFGDTSDKFMVWDASADVLKLTDNTPLYIGTGADLRIYHDGSNSYIDETGDGGLYIKSSAIRLQSEGGENMIYCVNDGAVNLYHNNVKKFETYAAGAGVTGNMYLTSSNYVHFDNGVTNDYAIRKNSTNLEFKTGGGYNFLSGAATFAGALTVGVDDTGHDVKFFGATSGRYMLWDESDDSLKFTDSTQIKIGSGNDLKIQHNGTDSIIANDSGGHLKIQQNVDDKDILFQCDDGSGGTETYFFLDGSANTGNYPVTTFPDNSSIALGTGQDMYLAHNGTDTNITNFVGHINIFNRADDKDIVLGTDDGSGGYTAYITLDGSSGYTKAHKHILYEDDAKAMFGTGGDMQILHDGSFLGCCW